MIEPRAWMISDPDGKLATAVTMRPQNPVSETGLVIDKLVTVADVLAALREPSMIDPRAWMISDPDGELATAVTMRPQNPVSETGLVIDKLVTVADVLAALRDPSEAMIEAAVGTATECDACIRPQYSVDALWNAMLDQFEKEQSGNASINAAKRRYEAANPLGGPARMFEAIAERIRSGENYYAVLADYGVTVEWK